MNGLRILSFPPLGYASAEAINTLCTNLTFSGENVKKIMMTSCHMTEGKTFLAMNIARTLAGLGYRVALVDADLRKSVIAKRYRLRFADEEHSMGLAQYLAGQVNADEVIYATDLNNMYMVPIGRTVANSLQLLNSSRFDRLLGSLAEQLDYVIIDAPPVGQIIDAAQIAKSCDGILLGVKYNSIGRQELIDVRDQLLQTGCPILGTVLNQVSYDAYLNKKYYYKSYYSHYDNDAPKEDGRKKKKR